MAATPIPETAPSRVKTACQSWGITTLEALYEAHKAGKTASWKGIGKYMLAQIDELVKPIAAIQQAVSREWVKTGSAPMDPIERQARNICRHADDRKSTHKAYWDRPLTHLAQPDRAKVEIAIAALKAMPPRRTRKEPALAAPYGGGPVKRADMPLHEQLEAMGLQTAIAALRSGLARDVTSARRWYLLAADVRQAAERKV